MGRWHGMILLTRAVILRQSMLKEQESHANPKPTEEKAKEQDGQTNPDPIEQEKAEEQYTNDPREPPA